MPQKMTQRIFWSVAGLLGLLGTTAEAFAHGKTSWSVGIDFGAPVYPRPWCGCGPDFYYYRPYPIYVPPPVYVAPAPVVVQPAPIVQPASVTPPVYQAPPPRPLTSYTPVANDRSAGIDQHLQLLADPDERVRLDSVTQLGRLRADRAVDPLAATLAGDRSPSVREAAARSLGLIASPKALPALQQAARADSDQDVRHSAQLAVSIIQSRQ